MYYAVIGLIRWTQNMPLLGLKGKPWIFTKNRKVKGGKHLGNYTNSFRKIYGYTNLWGWFVHMDLFPGAPSAVVRGGSFMDRHGLFWSVILGRSLSSE